MRTMMRRSALTVTLLSSLLVSGCFSTSSTPSSKVRTAPLHGPEAKGTIEGRVFTTACAGPAASSCVRHNYRGSLVFCQAMNQIGFCPSAHVDRAGRYEIMLRPGRYALIAAPDNGNVVEVTPRWVVVGDGRSRVSISGGNSTF
jgi:hypothetical protein